MNRIRRIILWSGLALFAAATYRQEHSSRYHMDTLRIERFSTARVLGIPIVSYMLTFEDPYHSAYSEITGKKPDSSHWKSLRADYVRYPWMAMYHCGGFSYEFDERRELLRAVYEHFRIGMPKASAVSYLAQIDELLPAQGRLHHETDLLKVHSLRRELDLKSYLDSSANP